MPWPRHDTDQSGSSYCCLGDGYQRKAFLVLFTLVSSRSSRVPRSLSTRAVRPGEGGVIPSHPVDVRGILRFRRAVHRIPLWEAPGVPSDPQPSRPVHRRASSSRSRSMTRPSSSHGPSRFCYQFAIACWLSATRRSAVAISRCPAGDPFPLLSSQRLAHFNDQESPATRPGHPPAPWTTPTQRTADPDGYPLETDDRPASRNAPSPDFSPVVAMSPEDLVPCACSRPRA